MKKLLFPLLVVLLFSVGNISANAVVLVYTVSASGGVGYGNPHPKTTTSGMSHLVMTPESGGKNIQSNSFDMAGSVSFILATARDINSSVTDTIVEDFDYRIRFALQAPGVNTTTLGASLPSFPYVEFRHRGMFTIERIQEGSAFGTFNSLPVGGSFGEIGASSQTLYLVGFGNITLSLRSFSLPASPQFDVINGDFRSDAFLYYHVEISQSTSVSGHVTLQGAANQAQSLLFEFRPTDNSGVFQRFIIPNADGSFTLPSLPSKSYTIHVKGTKWLAKQINVDATEGNVSNVNFMLLAGDVNNDNAVDITDLLLVIARYNKTQSTGDYLEAADFNGDGANDITDLLLLIGNYNQLGDS